MLKLKIFMNSFLEWLDCSLSAMIVINTFTDGHK